MYWIEEGRRNTQEIVNEGLNEKEEDRQREKK